MDQKRHVILVVEDDALLRLDVSELLLGAGYDVLEACDAAAAIEVLEDRSDVSLLFTDVEMPPGADGLTLAQIVSERWPRISLLVTSGGMSLQPEDVPDGGEFVQKPYPGTAVLGRIKNLIASQKIRRS